tara:strand:+ start:2964 stop:3425 length:462 start_codon:yes stop_codon:yes gene_type:complete
MTFSFHEQMRFIRQDYNNKIINSVFPHETWTIQDYIDFHLCISNGYLVQECGSNFKIGFTDDFTEDTTDDFYTQHFSHEDKAEHYIVYDGSVSWGIGSTMCDTENRYLDFKEAQIAYNDKIREGGCKAVYMDKMTWDECCMDWEQNSYMSDVL